MLPEEIFGIIDQDSGEEIDHGQTVRDTFPQADVFLRVDTDTDSQIASRVERFLHLILGTKVLTPTHSERAIYLAASAAGNSACLSRQVGASLTDKDGNMIAASWPPGSATLRQPASPPAWRRSRRSTNIQTGPVAGGKSVPCAFRSLAGSNRISRSSASRLQTACAWTLSIKVLSGGSSRTRCAAPETAILLNIVLHATRAVDGEHRSYRIDRIQGVRATRQSFIPRFAVELTPQGPPVIPATASRVESPGLPRRRARAAPRRTR